MARDYFPLRYVFGLLILTALILSGCVRNEPWRSAIEEDIEVVYTPEFRPNQCEPQDPCAKALVEVFKDESNQELFEINYIEFTERGNVFDTKRTEFVLNRIKQYATDDDGVITIVFIHGWKNNASTQNDNVKAFRNRLELFVDDNTLIGRRKVVGLYIGWRGASVSLPLIKELTFWDRKSVAQKIGKGGVTDVLLDLEHYDAQDPRNVLVVVGHSFGGAILLSAYSELVLDRIKSLANGDGTFPADTPLADALVLINPAIEANEMLPVKEAIIKHQPWNPSTPNLMRVLSTKADKATHQLFPLGQLLGTVVTWNQDQLFRSYLKAEENPEALKYLHERTLDRTTVGNFLPYHTQEMLPENETYKSWEIKDLCDANTRQLKGKRHTEAPTFPCGRTDPVQFVYTPEEFMNGHSDIFNAEVSAYIISSINSAILDSGEDTEGQRVKQSSYRSFEDDFKKIYDDLKKGEPEESTQ